MSKFNSIEEIKCWKESIQLIEQIYQVTNNSLFSKDFGLRDQIRRSSISIPSNIAEGFERESNQEFIRFLYIAKGSCGELRTQTYISFRLRYISEKEYHTINEIARKISSMIMKLIHALKHSNF